MRLAERYDRMILHEESELGHSYRVADEGLLYIYLVGNTDSGARPPLPILAAPETPTANAAAGPESRAGARPSLLQQLFRSGRAR